MRSPSLPATELLPHIDFHSTMLFALTFLILLDCIQARPIPTQHLDQCPSACHDSRTISNIVWSSLVTLFACIWVAVHPNIPAFEDGKIEQAKQRVKLLLTALIAPEFIVMFATRQWVCARRVMRSAFGRERGWTQTHGFFLVMGGFILYDSDGERPLYPLDLKNIEELFRSGAIDFPNIVEKEIQDRSKGDIISKGLAIIQTGWFIMQIIARAAEHLAITELEIMTVAFAFLNLITYIFWWNKPLNVTCPVRIVLKEGRSAPEPGSPRTVSFLDRIVRMVTLANPDRDDEVDLLREKRVPTFHAGRIHGSWYTLMIAGVLVAMTFGGIHCIAWSFSFPTHMEQILWRASSIAIISIPFLFLVMFLAADTQLLDLEFLNLLAGSFTLLSLLIYPVARVVLLILSCISLRSLPSSAFYTVRWIAFIPHVG